MDRACGELWDAACRILAGKLSGDVFARWIAGIRSVSCSDEQLVLAVANDFYVCWLEENYLPLIRMAVAAAGGRERHVLLQVDHHGKGTLPPAPPAAPRPSSLARTEEKAPARRSRLVAALNPSFTFSAFVVGPSNLFAHTASMAVAQAPARAYNPLLIYGGPGLGKTHLMQAIGHYVSSAQRGANICYVSAEAFLNEFIEAIQANQPNAFRRKFRGMDLLLIDDIHFLAGKDAIQEEFFHTFNELHNAHKQIVISSDRPPSEVPGLEPRLVSRFEWGCITQIEPPDLETRVAILRKKTEGYSLPLPDKVLFYIAERIRNDIRALGGALTSVMAFATMNRSSLSDDELETLLRHAVARATPEPPSFEIVQKAVAEHFDLRVSDLTGRRRPNSVALPRQVAMYLCRSLTAHSLPVIGEAFARNHATVLYACRTVEDRMKSDPSFRHTVNHLRRQLGAS